LTLNAAIENLRWSSLARIGCLTLLLLTVDGCADPERTQHASRSFLKLLGLSIKEHFERFCQMMKTVAGLGWLLVILLVVIVILILLLRHSQAPNVRRLAAKGDIQGLLQALVYKRNLLTYTSRPQHEQYENNVAASIRAEAAFTLGKIHCKEAVDGLIDALQDWNRDVRINAVRALIEIGDMRAVEPLLDVARNDPDDYARHSVQEALRAKGF